jgi:hypothetical protein
MYKLTPTNQAVLKTDEGLFIPFDPGNRHYQEYLEWVDLGNTPDPAFTEIELKAQQKQELTDAIQLHLDTTAIAAGYDSILSACSYAPVANSFQTEGIAFLNWRSNCWDVAIATLADVEANIIPAPTVSEMLALLPTAP